MQWACALLTAFPPVFPYLGTCTPVFLEAGNSCCCQAAAVCKASVFSPDTPPPTQVFCLRCCAAGSHNENHRTPPQSPAVNSNLCSYGGSHRRERSSSSPSCSAACRWASRMLWFSYLWSWDPWGGWCCSHMLKYHSVPKNRDARYSPASHSTHTSARSGTLTQAEKASVFLSHDFPLMKLGQVSPLASHNRLLLFKTGVV